MPKLIHDSDVIHLKNMPEVNRRAEVEALADRLNTGEIPSGGQHVASALFRLFNEYLCSEDIKKKAKEDTKKKSVNAALTLLSEQHA